MLGQKFVHFFSFENLRQPQFRSEISRPLVSACFYLAENNKMLSVDAGPISKISALKNHIPNETL